MAGVDILATAFSGANLAYIADQYARWVAKPDSVDILRPMLVHPIDAVFVSIVQPEGKADVQ